MEMCDEVIKKRKTTIIKTPSFAKTWLTDDRYKFWICRVSSDSSVYYCTICNESFSCSIHVSRHANSACHKQNIKKDSLSDMEVCNEKTVKRRKQSFLQAWLTDERYKSWIHEVLSDNSIYYCSICKRNFSCLRVSKHANTTYHKNRLPNNLLSVDSNDDDDNLRMKKSYKKIFRQKWSEIEEFKCWSREDPRDEHLYYCLIFGQSSGAHLLQIYLHADSKTHLDKCKSNCSEINKLNDDTNKQRNESNWSFTERRRRAEIKFAAFIADKNIPYRIVMDILNCFQEIGKDPNILQSMSVGRPKCSSFITNDLYPVRMERVVSRIQKSFGARLSHIYLHADSKTYLRKYKNRSHKIKKSNDNFNSQIVNDEALFSFNERKKKAEIIFAALMVDKNIPHQMAKDILSYFQHITKENPLVLQNIVMGSIKCKYIITNVLGPVETKRVVNRIQKTKFSVFIDEAFDIFNDKWMTFFVRYVDSKTLNTYSQLVKLIEIDAKNSSAEQLFHSFKCEMWKLQIPFDNIVALCDNLSVMIGKFSSFKTKLQSVCPRLLTFPCPYHSTSLAAYAASNKIPGFCEEFTRNITSYINSSSKRSAIFHEFLECFQETDHKIVKLCDTRWLCQYLCVKRLLESWDSIRLSLNETVANEKTKLTEYLLSIMCNVETKAYFLFLKYILNFFDQFNAYFQVSETRIHELQTKSLNFLFDICKHFLKDEYLKPFVMMDVVFSLKENQKNLNEINLGSNCEKYLDELMHEDVIATIRENCLAFYVTAAEEIRKRLPVKDIFLSKLNVFRPSASLFETDRETSFNDVSFVIKTIGGFDEDALKKEWIALPLDFTTEEKESLSKLNFDNMWKNILQRQHPNNIAKYPNLTSVLNCIRALPHSNVDSERMFSPSSDLKTRKRQALSSATINASCVFKSALKARGESYINMTVEKEYLSLMSAKKLYVRDKKKTDHSTLKLHAADNNDIAGPSWAD